MVRPLSDVFISLGLTQLLFSQSVNITNEGNVGSATGASMNILKTQDHNFQVRETHALDNYYLLNFL
jgi:hypothetical protein